MPTVKRTTPQLWCSLDGSGKFNDRRFICWAGYVAEVEALEAFGRDWAKMLDSRGMPYLHMKEVRLTFRGRPQDLKALLLECARVISAHRLTSIAFGVDAKQIAVGRFERSEQFLYVKVVEAIIPTIPEDAGIMILCDEDENLAEHLYMCFRKLRLDDKTRQLAERIKLTAIADDTAFPSLQAADLLSYMFVQEMDRRRSRPNDPRDELYALLTTGSANHGVHLGQIYEPTEFKRAAGLV